MYLFVSYYPHTVFVCGHKFSIVFRYECSDPFTHETIFLSLISYIDSGERDVCFCMYHKACLHTLDIGTRLHCYTDSCVQVQRNRISSVAPEVSNACSLAFVTLIPPPIVYATSYRRAIVAGGACETFQHRMLRKRLTLLAEHALGFSGCH